MQQLQPADARQLLIDRITAVRPDWTEDQRLPNAIMDDGNLGYPLHQMMLPSDPELHIRRQPNTWDVYFEVPRLGDDWELNIDTAITDAWNVRLHHRPARGYALTCRATTLAELDDALARTAARIDELAAMSTEERRSARSA